VVRMSRRRSARFAVTLVAVFAIVIAFSARLVDIQVVRAATLAEEAAAGRAIEVPVYGVRGDIVDANGAVLAATVERYDITVSPRVALEFSALNGAVDTQLSRIADIIDADPRDLKAILTEDPKSDYAVLARGLTLEQYQAIDALDIAWTYPVRVEQRSYPNG